MPGVSLRKSAGILCSQRSGDELDEKTQSTCHCYSTPSMIPYTKKSAYIQKILVFKLQLAEWLFTQLASGLKAGSGESGRLLTGTANKVETALVGDIGSQDLNIRLTIFNVAVIRQQSVSIADGISGNTRCGSQPIQLRHEHRSRSF